MFENKPTHNRIFYSQYIASWKSIGGKIYRGGLFERWLREKEQLTDEEIRDILNIADGREQRICFRRKKDCELRWAF